MNYDMNLDYDQVQRLINKIFENDQNLFLDKADLELTQKILFTRTREFQRTYMGSGNVIDNLRVAVENKLYENEDWYTPIKL